MVKKKGKAQEAEGSAQQIRPPKVATVPLGSLVFPAITRKQHLKLEEIEPDKIILMPVSVFMTLDFYSNPRSQKLGCF